MRRFRAEWERGASLRLREGDASVFAEYARHGRLVEGGTAEQTEAAAARAWLADTLAGQESLLLVPDNAHADRVCAGLRAELVRLGKVTEDGVPLGLQGTIAGVGDLIQARRNGWELLGFEGNTAAPINRATYRVTGLREDGGLVVAPLQRDVDGAEGLGESLQLPGGYVSQYVALAYASTVHAAEGRTVSTCHGVAGPGVNAAALYVMSSRGRERNTLWTVTTPVASDAPPGAGAEVVSRTAHAVLADILQGAEQEMSAVAQREQAEIDALSVLRHGDRLILGIGLATTGRTAATLDRLVAQGVLDAHDRTRLAADEALGSLEQLLRTAELAGHDPDTVLAHAVASRDFDDARSVAQTLHARISTTLTGQLTPTVTSHADLIPRDVPAQWRPWLDKHAADADNRRQELGAQMAASVPQWAREALGALPEDPGQRAEWERKAGYVAAYRELTGYDSEADPLGFAPGAGCPRSRRCGGQRTRHWTCPIRWWRSSSSPRDSSGYASAPTNETPRGHPGMWPMSWKPPEPTSNAYAATPPSGPPTPMPPPTRPRPSSCARRPRRRSPRLRSSSTRPTTSMPPTSPAAPGTRPPPSPGNSPAGRASNSAPAAWTSPTPRTSPPHPTGWPPTAPSKPPRTSTAKSTTSSNSPAPTSTNSPL